MVAPIGSDGTRHSVKEGSRNANTVFGVVQLPPTANRALSGEVEAGGVGGRDVELE